MELSSKHNKRWMNLTPINTIFKNFLSSTSADNSKKQFTSYTNVSLFAKILHACCVDNILPKTSTKIQERSRKTVYTDIKL